jgi:hypothetical protein
LDRRARAQPATSPGSLSNVDKQPIQKTSLFEQPVALGSRPSLINNAADVPPDHDVEQSSHVGASLLSPGISRIIGTFGRALKELTVELGRSYANAAAERRIPHLELRHKPRPSSTRRPARLCLVLAHPQL